MRTIAWIALLAASPALAEINPAPPKPGEPWALVSLTIDRAGDVAACEVVETNMVGKASQGACMHVAKSWKADRKKRGQKLTQIVVIR